MIALPATCRATHEPGKKRQSDSHRDSRKTHVYSKKNRCSLLHRRALQKVHGDIPALGRYIELETISPDGGSMTVAEVVEEAELTAYLYRDTQNEGRLARTRGVASQFHPDDVVTTSRSYTDVGYRGEDTTVSESESYH